ncbi:PolC-type DNA polymerase III [Snodgrassella sp. ESL0324]|uniref:3'-5' exonuclease n=1 Tax=Snodgrassella sp. ESL0324 TaxID=2705033 RepID=UPI00158436F7|nr:3'-5' exonuclease [Snodgrassella sp. ESL0324]NUF08940.1 3'-5' exonuclease [Snodgrassella sp. ESL0324]
MYILGIDTETTGVGYFAKVVELGAILVDAKTLKTVDCISQRINPLISIPESASRIHGITDEDVKNEPTIEEVFKTSPFLNWLQGVDTIFGHNVKFDIRMIGGDRFSGKQILDTYPLVRKQFPEWENHKLQTAVMNLELEQRPAHAALSDIESTCDILRYFLSNLNLTFEDLLKGSQNKS